MIWNYQYNKLLHCNKWEKFSHLVESKNASLLSKHIFIYFKKLVYIDISDIIENVHLKPKLLMKKQDTVLSNLGKRKRCSESSMFFSIVLNCSLDNKPLDQRYWDSNSSSLQIVYLLEKERIYQKSVFIKFTKIAYKQLFYTIR